jgi:hypothetical protein
VRSLKFAPAERLILPRRREMKALSDSGKSERWRHFCEFYRKQFERLASSFSLTEKLAEKKDLNSRNAPQRADRKRPFGPGAMGNSNRRPSTMTSTAKPVS